MSKMIKVKLLKSYKIQEKLTEQQLNYLSKQSCSLNSVVKYDNNDVIFHVVEFEKGHSKEKDFYSFGDLYNLREEHPYSSYIPKCYVSLCSKQIELNFED